MSSNIRIIRVCNYCGEEFTAKTTVTKYCSHKCNSRDYKRRVKQLKIEASNKETRNTKPQLIKNPSFDAKSLISVKEFCETMSVSKSTLYRLFDDHKLNRVRIKGRVFISRKEIKNVFDV